MFDSLATVYPLSSDDTYLSSDQKLGTLGRVWVTQKQAPYGDQPVDGTGNTGVTPS